MLRAVRHPRFVLAPALVLASAALATEARAQSIQASGSGQPDRYVGANVAASCQASPDQLGCTRGPANNPAWVSYADCEANLVLHFPLALSGFAAADDLQVWVSPATGECISQGSRTDGSCVKVFDAGATASAASSLTAPVWVRDVLGNSRAESSCHTQPDDNPVQYLIWFLAVNAQSGLVDGTAYQYALMTDIVGPAPPGVASGSLAIADGSLNLSWTASSDPNVQGYDIFMDPAPGPQPNAPTPVGECDASTTTTQLECPDGSGPPVDAATGDDGASDDSGDDGASEAAAPPPVDAGPVDSGCVLVPVSGGSSNTCSTQCSSGALIQTVTPLNSGGGISTVDSSFFVMQAAGAGSSSATLTNLVDGTQYNVVISSYDSVNNIGPPTGELCQTPAAVGDFFRNYREAGGTAGGGFCTLENAGAPVGTGIGALVVGAAVAGAVRRAKRRRVARRRGP